MLGSQFKFFRRSRLSKSNLFLILMIFRLFLFHHKISFIFSAFPQVKISINPIHFNEVVIKNIQVDSAHAIHARKENLSWKIVEHQLPVELKVPTNSNLLGIVRIYKQNLDYLKPFYASLQMLDEVCCIGEPDIVTTKTDWRLVKYSNKVFIKIEFKSPLNISEVSVTFHGETNSVKEMEEIFNQRWGDHEDDENTIYDKILNIFDLPYFPATDEDTIDCSICLSYRCENNRCPVVYCDNEKCQCSFHIGCLEKYLKVEKHVEVLSVCIGECPFCKQTLSNSYAPFFQRILDKN